MTSAGIKYTDWLRCLFDTAPQLHDNVTDDSIIYPPCLVTDNGLLGNNFFWVGIAASAFIVGGAACCLASRCGLDRCFMSVVTTVIQRFTGGWSNVATDTTNDTFTAVDPSTGLASLENSNYEPHNMRGAASSHGVSFGIAGLPKSEYPPSDEEVSEV